MTLKEEIYFETLSLKDESASTTHESFHRKMPRETRQWLTGKPHGTQTRSVRRGCLSIIFIDGLSNFLAD